MTPRKDTALQVISTTWDSVSACLFTGDETGRLRCWSLRNVLEALGSKPPREATAQEGQLNSLDGDSEGGRGGRLGEDEDSHDAGSTLRTQARKRVKLLRTSNHGTYTLNAAQS